MKQEIDKDWLLGRWESADEDCLVIFEISKAGKGFKVRVYAMNGNEEHVVSKTKWDGKSLRFETFVPSNNWRTRNCLTAISRTKIVQELTYWETWKKTRRTKVLWI